jgi:hypothetical protein
MIASSISPHFWVEIVSTATYLINIQPSSALQGGITFECLYDKTSYYSCLRLFGCVSYVLLAPRERTKLIAQSIECILLGYSAEHKSYRCWDLVARRMRTSQDVVFDESHHFYLRPSADASPVSLVNPLSSSESPLVVPDYTMKPPVTQFYSHHGARLSDAPAFSDELSSDVSSSFFIEDVSSSPPVEPSSPVDSSPEQLN